MNFLKNILATILGLLVFSFLIFFLLIGVASAVEGDEDVEIAASSVLSLKLSGVIQERVVDDPFEELFPNATASTIGLHDLVAAIKHAKEDSKIKGIMMDHQFLSAGFSSLQEVRDALVDFKSSGKFIYAYGEYLSEADYYLASVADKLFMNPEGSLEFNGLVANITFWKGLFDKLEVKPEIFRVGEYKSYVEPFIRKDMSPENRFQYNELLASIYDTYLSNVAITRNIDKVELTRYSKELLVQLPEDAVNLHLVDSLGYKDQVLAMVASDLGIEDTKDIKFVSVKKYNKSYSDPYAKDRIAVIFADGSIVNEGDDSQIVGYKLAKEIKKARENKAIKAIVLRINSPGGSLIASDLIWHEISLTKGVKPIIASMSDVAASGGYYIAMQCDTIIAQPNTITGSIGIFGMMFNLEDFLENKLGITHDVVKTGDHSDLYTVTRSLTDFEKGVIQKGVEKGYQTFLNKAAKGRGVSPDEIDKVGGGRVWTGAQALEIGLIDIIGNYNDAVTLAAIKGGISDDYKVVFYPAQKTLIEQFIGDVQNEVSVRLHLESRLLAPYLKQLEELNQMKGIQARLPMDIVID